MELCSRCTSTVADGAQSCPSCGAEVWRPGSQSHQAAVTPAPVALVLPVPAAAPPPASAPPPLPATAEQLSLPMPDVEPAAEPAAMQEPVPVGHDIDVHSVVVNLPPQRVAPTAVAPKPEPAPEPAHEVAPPASPPWSATVVPADPPAHHKPSRTVVAIGTIAPLLAVVVLIIALPAHGAKPKHVAVVATDADAQFDLRALADAEETSLTATESYATDSTALDAAGYQPAPGKPVTISAGVSKSGYCLVASAGTAAAPWYLYDSKQGGLVSDAFAGEAVAQQSCADTAVNSYVPIT